MELPPGGSLPIPGLAVIVGVGWQPTIKFVWEIYGRLHNMGRETIKINVSRRLTF
jgi:hypothetical protein